MNGSATVQNSTTFNTQVFYMDVVKNNLLP